MEQGPLLVGAAGVVLAAITIAGVIHVRELNAPKPIAALPAETAAIAPVTPTQAPNFADPQPAAPRELPPVEQPAAAPAAAAATVDPVALKTARRSVDIVMFTTTWCPQCKRAKAWMHDNDVAYTEHDIEASPQAMRDCKKLNPSCSIPTMDIDGEVFIGFGAEALRATVDRAARRHLH